MKKMNLRDLRVMLTVNFMAEVLCIVTLYLSAIHSIKVLKIDILSFLFLTVDIVGILLILKLVKNKDKEKLIALASLVLELVLLILSIFVRTRIIVPYFQVTSDILKFLVILSIYNNLYKPKKKKEKEIKKRILLIIIISYAISKISYMIINFSKGLTFRPIMTTLSIIGIVVAYGLYIKDLEKR